MRRAVERWGMLILVVLALVASATATVNVVRIGQVTADNAAQTDAIAELQENRILALARSSDLVLASCQRDNEGRAALQRVEERLGLAFHPEATRLDDCRATVFLITGTRLPPDTPDRAP